MATAADAHARVDAGVAALGDVAELLPVLTEVRAFGVARQRARIARPAGRPLAHAMAMLIPKPGRGTGDGAGPRCFL